MTKPFKIKSENINRLSDTQLTQLLRELLHSEAHKFGIPQSAIEVSSNTRAGDGGEDGRISWSGEPENTDYLPNRLTMFQIKATQMGPADYANEIMSNAKSGESSVLKPKVEEVLDQGGAYIFFTTQELNTQQKDRRIEAIRKKLDEQSKDYAYTCQLKIYDAAQIADWTNQFIPTIVSVQHWVGVPVERGLKTFKMWSEHEDLSHLPFASVDSRKEMIATLSEKIKQPRSCFRLMGLSGLGKTRAVFEVFKEHDSLKNLVVYMDANHTPRIDALVADWVSLNIKAIVVVDNCEYHLHESLVDEVRQKNSQISLITMDYNLDSVSNRTVWFKLNPMTDNELLSLLNPIYQNQLPDLDRIVAFAQGFPKMAVLLVDARLSEDPRIGELSEDKLANKLLWRKGEGEDSEKLEILQACSLFDVFGIEQRVEIQLKFIADLVGIHIDKVYECVQEYSDRGLIDRRGRFGQVVPKPLAIRLAGQWWRKSREDKQLKLIKEIPEDMIDAFCHQVGKMDFHPNVKKLTENLCGLQGPFGQAEVILSIRGSRLFRAFVNVNPESTSRALYQALENLNTTQLLAIEGDIRRNLLWALERLCYHSDVFPDATWCMLLLASAENEGFSNNATGMFAQLFRVQLSGTAAKPEVRFALLRRALALKQSNVDMVLLEALGQAIDTLSGSRMVGAEYQGMKAPLEEWRPDIWQEIFDFWEEAFELLLVLLERGEAQKQKVLSCVGRSIRGFVAQGRIEMLDLAIRRVVSVHGRYWPAALESIKNTFQYDAERMRPEAERALNSWLELLIPDDAELPEKLKILVINPPWEHREDEDGHYIDVASENAKALAKEVASNIGELFLHLDMLLHGEQKQSDAFGLQLAHELDNDNIRSLIELSFERMLVIEQTNPRFLVGVYRGVFEQSQEKWHTYIDMLTANEHLLHLYPEFIRTGSIQKPHLEKLLDLIRSETISPRSADVLRYGRVIDDIPHDVITDFCLLLGELGDQASWLALNVIYAYCFGNKGRVQKLRKPLKKLVSSVSWHEGHKDTITDAYQWHDLAEKLLKEPDEKFAVALADQLIAACQDGLNYGDMQSYIKPLLLNLMRDYSDVLWPIFGNAIVRAEGMERVWLQQLLDRKNSFPNQMPSVLSVAPVDDVIAWCKSNPQLGPQFVADSVNILESEDNGQQPSTLFIALLEKFGCDQRVANALEANMGTRSWSGSLVPYLESDKAALSPLLEHHNSNVRDWVRNHIANIDRQMEAESMRDEERDIGLL